MNPNVNLPAQSQLVKMPLQLAAELLGDAGRSRIRRRNQTAHLVDRQIGEAPLERRSPRFGGNALAVSLGIDHPADLDHRPAFGKPRPAATDELAARAIFDRQNRIAAKLLVPHDRGDLPPRRRAIERLAVADVAHQLGVAVQTRQCIEVALHDGPQSQPRRFQSRHTAHRSILRRLNRVDWQCLPTE